MKFNDHGTQNQPFTNSITSAHADDTMRDGIPKKYWVFRNLVSIAQILIVLGGLFGAVSWVLADNNGARLWHNYFSFSQGVSAWANSELRMPWDPSGADSQAEMSKDDASDASWFSMCNLGTQAVFEAQTTNVTAVVCQDSDGALTFIASGPDDAWAELPAEDRGDYWAATDGTVTYGLGESGLSVIDNATNEYTYNESLEASIRHEAE